MSGRAGMVTGALAVLAAVAGAVLHHVNVAAGWVIEPSFWLLHVCAALSYGAVGGWLAGLRRVPVIPWIFLGIGLAHGMRMLIHEYAVLAAHVGWPLAGPALWVGSWLWVPAHLAIGALLPLLLPDGRLPSPRWRPALVLAVLAVAGNAVSLALLPYDLQDFPFDVEGLTNPVGVIAIASPPVQVLTFALGVFAVGVALASLAVRVRRSTGVQRQQLKWVLLGFLGTLAMFVAGLLTPPPTGQVIAALAVLPIPLACGVAVLRYRLWDVDIVLSRSLAYGALSAAVVASYLIVVGLLGGVLGAGAGAPLVATVVVALLVLPLQGRLQRMVNHLVHGEGEDPYTALARLGDRLEATTDPAEVADQLLPEVLARVARLLRSPYAAIELADGESVEHGTRPAALTRVPLEYGGASIGALVLGGREGQSSSERRRLAELARQAAVAVHAVLLAREVRRSRQLAVSIREEERRRLRRDLHDGLGPALAGLALQAETARDLVGCDPAAAIALLDRLVPRLNEAVADVRALVHDLRPPTLDELGLAGALHELATRFAAPQREVRVEVGELGQLSAAVDVAAYRIVAEAVANAARHANPRTVTVAVHRNGTCLQVEVTDDGCGIDPAAPHGVGLASLRERSEELGGQCLVTRRRDSCGTEVCATLPLEVPA